MSDIDWKTFDDPKFDPKRIPLFDEPPKRDMAVKDGDTIKLGNTEFKLYVIPGHTLGTLATVFTVHDKGKAHRAVAWGGTAYNFGPLADRLQIYADTTAKYRDVMKKENADVLLSNHVSYDNAVEKMAHAEGQEAGRAQSLRGRRGYRRPLPHRARRMRARDQGLCRGGPAGEGRREEVTATAASFRDVSRSDARPACRCKLRKDVGALLVASPCANDVLTASAAAASPAS